MVILLHLNYNKLYYILLIMINLYHTIYNAPRYIYIYRFIGRYVGIYVCPLYRESTPFSISKVVNDWQLFSVCGPDTRLYFE